MDLHPRTVESQAPAGSAGDFRTHYAPPQIQPIAGGKAPAYVAGALGDDVVARLSEYLDQRLPPPTRLEDLWLPYEAYLREGDPSDDQVADQLRRCRIVCEGLETTKDLTPLRVSARLAEIQKRPGKGGHTMSKESMAKFRKAIKRKTRWIVDVGLLPSDPLSRMASPKPRRDQRRKKRRAFTIDELTALMAAARIGPNVEAIPGEDREMLYDVCAYTGLRKSEIGSVTTKDFDLDACTVRVNEDSTKNGKEAIQVYPEHVRDRLAVWLPTKPTNRVLWPVSGRKKRVRDLGGKNRKTHKMVQIDGRAAGLRLVTDAGELVFHCLRHFLATSLARAGVTLQLAQIAMRHASPELTANTYTHLPLDDLREAVAKIPPPK